MNALDLLFSPKGTIKPQPFAIVVASVYLINIIAGSVLDGQFIQRAGLWPYLGMQVLLTWIWFAAHAKRLRDSGRGWTTAAVFAVLYAIGIVLMINLVAASAAEVTQAADPKEPRVTLIGAIIAVLFINALLTGDIYLIVGLMFLFIAVPMIFSLVVVVYSIVTGARPSVTADPLPPSPAPQPLPPA